MDKRFVVILVVIVAAFGGFLAFGRKSSAPGTDAATGKVSYHAIGDSALALEIVEYGDFQCPSCGQFFPIVGAIKQQYAGRIRFVFKNFPLDSIHKNARAAHRTAEAAGLQGKFFEMHDLLYQNQNNWNSLSNPKTVFDSYAKQLGLDQTKFDTDFASEEVNATINADVAEGQGKKVAGTPTFFFNGTQIENTKLSSVALFSAKIDELLAGKAPQAATPPAAPASSN